MGGSLGRRKPARSLGYRTALGQAAGLILSYSGAVFAGELSYTNQHVIIEPSQKVEIGRPTPIGQYPSAAPEEEITESQILGPQDRLYIDPNLANSIVPEGLEKAASEMAAHAVSDPKPVVDQLPTLRPSAQAEHMQNPQVGTETREAGFVQGWRYPTKPGQSAIKPDGFGGCMERSANVLAVCLNEDGSLGLTEQFLVMEYTSSTAIAYVGSLEAADMARKVANMVPQNRGNLRIELNDGVCSTGDSLCLRRIEITKVSEGAMDDE